MIRSSFVLTGLLLTTACATLPKSAPGKSAETLDLNHFEKTAEQDSTPAAAGRAALTVWIITGDAGRAERWVKKALQADAGEPQALYTRILIAREALDDKTVTESAVAILQRSPGSPFAELAVARLREVVNQSPALDKIIGDTLAGLDTGSLKLEGHAAFRARELLSGLREGHNDDAGLLRSHQAQGVPTEWSVIGPIQANRLRDFDRPTAFDDARLPLAGTYGSVIGGTHTRKFQTPAGILDMEPETWRADIFEALSDVTAKEGGEYLISFRGTNEATVFLDGIAVLRRQPLPARPPERSWAVVELPAGKHRLRVKFGRVDAGWFALALARSDGAPADLSFIAAPIRAVPPPVTAEARPSDPWGINATPAGEAESPVDRFLSIQQNALDSSEVAREQLSRLQKEFADSSTLRGLDADLATTDPDLPRANMVARVTQDLEAVLKATPTDARALIGRFQQERSEKRYDEAEARLRALVEVVSPNNARVLLDRARFALDRGDASQARSLADASLKADPDRCDSLAFRADLARRDGEVARSESLVPRLGTCPGGLVAMTTYLRSRLKIAESIPYLERLLARTPASAAARRSLADAYFATGKADAAAEVLDPLEDLWPHENDPIKRQAAYRELEGDPKDARHLFEKALSVEGGDLTVARSLALDKHGDILDWAARDGLATIDAFKKSSFHPSASAIQVLDLGALEIQADGSSLERVQSIVQVLDKKGINQHGEVNIPGDAQALMVRTVKADGKILDAEIINGKDSISLPNLEPGDFVEYAFVRAAGPRPASTPGWQGGQFMFAGEDVPFFESTYLVRAPASIGMELDSDHLEPAAKVEKDGNTVTMTYTRHGSDAYVREPMPVSDAEVLPWLEVGAGAGQEPALQQYGDWVPLRTRVTPAIREFVQGTATLPPVERVKTIVDRLRTQVKGESSSMDFGDSASTVLQRTRGNRLLVLKAALAAVGVSSHLVFARPFTEYPHGFRFPHAGAYRAAVLRIDVPDQPPMWMDFTLRSAPLNQLPAILSEQEAFVLPNNASETVQRIKLPAISPEDDRTDTSMDLSVDADGTLTGVISQTAYGFDAAALRWRVEQVNATELRKQQERLLSRTFQGLTLVDFKIEDSGVPGTSVVARSTIKVPRFTNRGSGTPAIFANFGPYYLGPRFIRTGERRTPLLVPVDDLNRTTVTLKLAAQQTVKLPEPTTIDTPFGRYSATWTLKGDQLSLSEELLLRRGRVQPGDYAAFKAFAAAVDGAQNRQITLAAR
jgi:tetratricopeptide (TPR) repeat protein